MALLLPLTAVSLLPTVAVVGTLYEVHETDLRLRIAAELHQSKGVLASRQQDIELPRLQRRCRLNRFDPTVTLQRDIHLPTDPADQPLYPAGTRINPLAFGTPPTQLLFIDGDTEQQLDYADRLINRWPTTRVVLTSGEIKTARKQLDTSSPLYYASHSLLRRLAITHTPTRIIANPGDTLLTQEIGICHPQRPASRQ